MDLTWIAEILKQAPALGVLALFIWVYARQQGRYMDYLAQRDEVLKTIGEKCHTAHEEVVEKTTRSMEQCTEAIHENSRVLGEVYSMLRQINGAVK